MGSKKPRIVIIGAGMAGLTAANKLYKSTNLFDLSIVEGGTRIGGRINSSDFCGNQIEQGATWIHGIQGSPVYKIAQQSNLLHSHKPWECMDGVHQDQDTVTIAEGGHVLNPSIVQPITSLFENLMNFIQGKPIDEIVVNSQVLRHLSSNCDVGMSVGSFLRQGLEAYWRVSRDSCNEPKGVGNWERKKLEESIFAMNESIQRTFTSADDLGNLDYNAEKEYVMFPGDEITIAKGYSTVVESLASVLPVGMIQLGRVVERIEWHPTSSNGFSYMENGHGSCSSPVKLHFSDGSTMSADHVIVTVSLGVLKHGINQDCGLFNPPLPNRKIGAITRLGYGVVNKVFLQMSSFHDNKFPYLQMVFHPPNSDSRSPKIPNWIRKTSFLHPIYKNSRVLLSWFTGQEATELESLTEEEIINGFSNTMANLLSSNCHKETLKFDKVLRTQWGTNPLFLGSYSYVAVGSSDEDMDTLAEPLPQNSLGESTKQLQILFAGEATHRTHYSTTHGAYFSGLREADRLLKHYNCTDL